METFANCGPNCGALLHSALGLGFLHPWIRMKSPVSGVQFRGGRVAGAHGGSVGSWGAGAHLWFRFHAAT